MRAFRQLRLGHHKMVSLREKREHLYCVIWKWSNEVTEKKVFNLFKMAVNGSKEEAKTVRSNMLRSKKARAFEAWHGFQLYRKQLKETQARVSGKQGYW